MPAEHPDQVAPDQATPDPDNPPVIPDGPPTGEAARTTVAVSPGGGIAPAVFLDPQDVIDEMEDAESEDDESAPGARRTWAELDASTEADRRFDLEFLANVAVITERFVKSVEKSDGESDLKLIIAKYVPEDLEKDLVEFLRALNQVGTSIARRYS